MSDAPAPKKAAPADPAWDLYTDPDTGETFDVTAPDAPRIGKPAGTPQAVWDEFQASLDAYIKAWSADLVAHALAQEAKVGKGKARATRRQDDGQLGAASPGTGTPP